MLLQMTGIYLMNNSWGGDMSLLTSLIYHNMPAVNTLSFCEKKKNPAWSGIVDHPTTSYYIIETQFFFHSPAFSALCWDQGTDQEGSPNTVSSKPSWSEMFNHPTSPWSFTKPFLQSLRMFPKSCLLYSLGTL